jgi:hypothetical protein
VDATCNFRVERRAGVGVPQNGFRVGLLLGIEGRRDAMVFMAASIL